MLTMQQCDARMSSHSKRRMARHVTANLQESLPKDNKLQSLHGSGTILSDGFFGQPPQKGVKHFRTCSGCF